MANSPHGGILCELISTDKTVRDNLLLESSSLYTILLTQRQTCDIELLLNGGFSPLRGFMNKDDYERVVKEMRLVDGSLFTMPITLDVPQSVADKLTINQRVALMDSEGNFIAIITVESIYKPDKDEEALHVFGSNDEAHPAIHYLKKIASDFYIGGKLEGYQLPAHYDFLPYRKSPSQVRSEFKEKNWTNVVGFQTRNPLHRSHYELTTRAAKQSNCNLLLQPVVGMTKPGDVDHFTRVRCYLSLLKEYPKDLVLLNLLPLAMRMGGPREAVWHAIIRKNFGCTHFIVGRDHAGPGNNSQGKPFYGDYDSQNLVLKYASELSIVAVPFKMVVYDSTSKTYVPEDELKDGMVPFTISGTELRRKLTFGEPIPDWFSFPSVIEILRESFPSRQRQGFTIFLTGLSGSGKTTVANALMVRLMELTTRNISVLDGDVVRTHLSTELGFSKEHRDLNIKRIGYVASEITKARGIAITAAIAPYQGARQYARELISKCGGFCEVHLSTPLEVCEKRDRKGLYAKARAGIVKNFTGIDDPYEIPSNPDLRIDTSTMSVTEAIELVVGFLKNQSYL